MVKIQVCVGIDYTLDDIKSAITEYLPVERSEIGEIIILKKMLKIEESISYSLTLGVSFGTEREAGLLKMKKKVSELPDYTLNLSKASFTSRPLVVGAGPAGLFCALALALSGAKPIVIERGEPVEQRKRSVDVFFSERLLNEESNIQFGEGGAGAFSDGKLKVGGMDKYKYKVLSEFVQAGAPEDIIYTVGAHLGTDKLPTLVKNIREKIISLGGEFHFSSKLCGIKLRDGAVIGAEYLTPSGKEYIETDRIILAIGHSAKDTFEMLYSMGIPMEAKGFGIGVRIEHKREYINKLVLGDASLAGKVGTASYHLVTHLDSGRSVYSFCMCPGGTVVAAASKEGGIVTNGMSEYGRDAENSNAAFLVSVEKSDFPSDSPLCGMEMQRQLESLAFCRGGADYRAPVCRMDDFLDRSKPTSVGDIMPSYPCGYKLSLPDEYLPSFITDSLRAGIMDFDKWMPGFYTPDAILTGAETRSTSPVRILRNKDFTSASVKGLYPIGEGAGYSGGIVSSAVDGVRAAEAILNE